MGNAQSMIRTSGALDSFVADLGPDIVYEGRYVRALHRIRLLAYMSLALGLLAS